jgi:hypothetical protein
LIALFEFRIAVSQTPHDQFAKQFLEQLFTPNGLVETSHEVLGEARFIDLWFQPYPEPRPSSFDLGFLAVIARSPCLIEPYRNAIAVREIQNCLAKRFALIAALERKSQSFSSGQPLLWILTPTLSNSILESFSATPNSDFLPGIYSLAPALGTHIIVLHQLPAASETLWLRLLAKGGFQQRAIQEVLALPPVDTRRDLALRLLVNWKIGLETIPSEFQKEEDLSMALNQAYLEWEQRTRDQGIQIGEQRGIQIGEQRGIQIGQQELIRLTLENLFRTRFGALDDPLETVIQRFLQFSTEEYSQHFPLVLSLSYEALIQQFSCEN